MEIDCVKQVALIAEAVGCVLHPVPLTIAWGIRDQVVNVVDTTFEHNARFHISLNRYREGPCYISGRRMIARGVMRRN